MFEQGLPKRLDKPKGWLWGQFENARGGSLRYGQLSINKTPRAHIVYVEGLSEYAEKTYELARDFNDMACNFTVLDRYGQGKSTRYFEHAPQKQHSDGIDHDIDDLIAFCKETIPEGEPIILLGHSTGGMLALLALEKAPDLFKGAILSAPLIGIDNALVRNREKAIARLPMPQSLRESYIPGGGDWKKRDDPTSEFKPEDFSSDPERGALSDYFAEHDENLRTGSSTLGWIIETCRAIVRTRKPETLQNIKQPVLIFTAGEDVLVNNKHTFDALPHLPDVEHHHYEKGKHELLVESDDIRDDLLSKTYDFLKNKL